MKPRFCRTGGFACLARLRALLCGGRHVCLLIGLLRFALLTALLACAATAASDRLVIHGKNGPGKGKHIVLVSGDEEYRSEQALPQLARILSASMS